jgi:PadR family transcriptional regulator, regulatory protein AphA
MQESGRTQFLILGLLAEGPCSGYDIRRITQGRFRFFWSESFGQIYPCLRRLEAEGLIKRQGSLGRGRTIWALEARGREALAAWLALPAQPETARMEAMLKYYFSSLIEGEARLRLLREFRDRQAENLVELEAFREELLRIPDPHGNHGIALDTIELGVATYRAWRDWAAARL